MKLTDKQQNARAKAAGGYVTFDGTPNNTHARLFYSKSASKEMQRFIGQLNKELDLAKTPTEIREVFDRFNNYGIKTLEVNAEKITEKWMKLSTRESRGAFSKAMAAALGASPITISYGKRPYNNLLKMAIQRNVSLITNVGRQTLTNLETVIYDAVINGQGQKVIQDYLKEQTDIATRRIKFIARDQTAKTMESLNKLSQEASGVRFFEWDTAKDERVSTGKGGHKQLDGKIYAWNEPNNLPIIDAEGNRGKPGDRPNCRCTSLSVILKKDYEAIQNPDGSYRIKKGRYF